MLPKHSLLARAFHRAPSTIPITSSIHRRTLSVSSTSPGVIKQQRAFTATATQSKWEGSKPEDHVTNEGDKKNAQHDAEREGKKERANSTGSGEGESRGTGEGAGGSNKRAKEEFPEAPDTIGMQDERGGKS